MVKREIENDECSFQRSSHPVDNFFSALGSLKETRLTATLGYLIHQYPDTFGRLFVKANESIKNVCIEESDDKQRYDLVLKTDKRTILIEAKIGVYQNNAQLIRYIRRKKPDALVLVCSDDEHGISFPNKISRLMDKKVTTWAEVSRRLKGILHLKKIKAKATPHAIATEFFNYFETKGMNNTKDKEIYIKDLSGSSINLFFKYRIYKCQPKFYPLASRNIYFAPCFTAKAPNDFSASSMIRIEKGISWLAKILKVEVMKRNEVDGYLKSLDYLSKKDIPEARKLILGEHKEPEILVISLDEPILAFLTPVSKRKLFVRGIMGSRSFTFEELFKAARVG